MTKLAKAVLICIGLVLVPLLCCVAFVCVPVFENHDIGLLVAIVMSGIGTGSLAKFILSLPGPEPERGR